MFTGIVQGIGEIISLSEVNTVTTVEIKLPNVDNLAIGALSLIHISEPTRRI